MWYLDLNTQIFLVTIVAIFGFFIGHAMDGVLGDEGFGPYGNMSVIVTGFIASVFLMRYFGFSMRDLRLAATGGLAGSFTCLATLVLSKNILHRLGH